MKIDNKYKVEKTVSKNDSRVVLQNPYLNKDKDGEAVLICTDGKVMSSVPVTLEDGDTTGMVPLEAIRELQKDKKGFDALSLNGTAKLSKHNPNGGNAIVTEYPRPEGQYPNCSQVWPKGEVTRKITFSPDKLLDLARAIGISKGEGITITIRKPLDPIEAINGEAKGLLMPIRG